MVALHPLSFVFKIQPTPFHVLVLMPALVLVYSDDYMLPFSVIYFGHYGRGMRAILNLGAD